ncbi:MAG: CHAT domain-containing protein [Acidobacteria bacterium]|nr:CHAT domain-containing protein [Acidobacteriota bacterium]
MCTFVPPSSLIATLSEAYLGHFELAATKFSDPGKAYEIIEQARGRALADTLRGKSESLSSSDEISVRAQKDINRIQLALLHETSRHGRQSLLDQLFAAEQLLFRVRRTTGPLKPATDRPKPIPLGTLQTSLGPDEMLLEYVLGQTQSYCLQITRTGVGLAVLPASRHRIENLVEAFLEAVRSKRSETALGKELFALLLQPVIGQANKSRLIVIPDRKLHLLPFDALRNDQEKYILESHVVSYVPSATVLHLLRPSRPSAKGSATFLGVGNVIYSESAVFAYAAGRPAPNDFFDVAAATLPNLDGSAEEVISVARIIGGGQMLLAENATEAAFKGLPLANFRIIHLAVHGIANTQFPDRAALMFGDTPGSGEDGLLQVREVRDLSLNADLVILSACDTGSGRLLGQEGIASLEYALLLAGAKSVIASLWIADDWSTTFLMKRLYEHLVEGYDKDKALRRAKLDLLDKFGVRALPVFGAFQK